MHGQTVTLPKFVVQLRTTTLWRQND